MRSMDHARERAREVRMAVGGGNGELLAALTKLLTETKNVSLVPMSREQLNGSRGEVDAEAMILKFDRALSDDERLELFAHELGHLELHRRLSDPNVPIDPVLASAYGDAGAAGIARYSPRMREETEANAFALEFLCPSTALLERWRAGRHLAIAALAAEHGVEESVVRVQLANALHDVTIGSDETYKGKSREITFTPEQIEAALFAGKPALVDAGPGTGKTATLIRRIQALLEEKSESPTNVLVLTFSNEAAQELGERIADRLGAEVADAMTISTFHGFGMEFLNLHGELVGLRADFSLLDDDAQVELVTGLLGRVPAEHLDPLRDPAVTAARIVEHINFCKHRLKTPYDFEIALAEPVPDSVGKYDPAAAAQLLVVWRAYERAKQEEGRIDFADLINLPVRILGENADIAASYRKKYLWVLVDEFQDVTAATSQLLHRLSGPENPPWVVGDARQSIYQFLGANPDNVRNFGGSFPEHKRFELRGNHRSSKPIVDAANQLATLLGDEDPAKTPPRWTAVGDATPLPDPVGIRRAASDYAESQGIVEQIKRWHEVDGVPLGEIAVLARRHIDVRNAILALTDHGIKAQAAGLLTAEGAGGDLAVVLTAEHQSPASIPRLAWALGHHILDAASINATIAFLLARRREGDAAVPSTGVSQDLTGRIERVIEAAGRAVHSEDGFDSLTTFLFESSDYLRDLLDAEETAERAMTLVEIVSVLSLATGYRATHRGVQPRSARLGFAARLRARLTESQPIPIIPRPRGDAVRVMTCHAAKGLEFPCVIVAGQTLPRIRNEHQWLPPSIRAARNEDVEQADSLLFVGVTRGRRAVVVSYPEKAGQGPRAQPKKMVPLLERWRGSVSLTEGQWTATGGSPERAVAGPVWGAPVPDYLKASALDSRCPIETYLEQYLGIRFREAHESLYPRVFAALRRVIRQIARRAIESGEPADVGAVRALLDGEFPAARLGSHPHYELYRSFAESAASGFVRAFRADPGMTALDPELIVSPSGAPPDIRLDFIAYLQRRDGTTTAIAFRPESFAARVRKGKLAWTNLPASARTPFVVLRAKSPAASLQVFSGADAAIHDYAWSQRPDTIPNAVAAITEQHAALAAHDFSTDVSPYVCDRCRVRVTCPYWMGALPPSGG